MARAEAVAGEPLGDVIRRRLADGQSVRDIVRALGLADNRQLHRIMARFDIPIPTPSEAVRKQWIGNTERRASQSARWKAWYAAHPEQARANSLRANLILQTTRPTSIERALMVALDTANIAYEFQYVVGDKFLCDFAFPDARLIVETDGSYWHRTPRQKKQDASKDAYLRACGFEVLRLTDVEITQHLCDSLQKIQALLDSK
jgi:very-short-patch-repair endonuclease